MKHTLTPLAQNLRKNQTKEEARLWYQFLRKYDVRFRRQFPYGPYIVDFYCAKAKIVVELDGSQHYDPETKKKDMQRSAFLEAQGLKILRFSNAEVNTQFQQVCEAIDMAVNARYKKEF